MSNDTTPTSPMRPVPENGTTPPETMPETARDTAPAAHGAPAPTSARPADSLSMPAAP